MSSAGRSRNHGKRAELEAWAREQRREELDYLEPGGSIDPSDDHPARNRALLYEWRRNVGQLAV